MKFKIAVLSLIFIVGIAVQVAPLIFGRVICTKQSKVPATLGTITIALKLYYLDHGYYPNSLDHLVSKSALGPYLPRKPKDPWGRAFAYTTNDSKQAFTIYSFGADGLKGGEKDNADYFLGH